MASSDCDLLARLARHLAMRHGKNMYQLAVVAVLRRNPTCISIAPACLHHPSPLPLFESIRDFQCRFASIWIELTAQLCCADILAIATALIFWPTVSATR